MWFKWNQIHQICRTSKNQEWKGKTNESHYEDENQKNERNDSNEKKSEEPNEINDLDEARKQSDEPKVVMNNLIHLQGLQINNILHKNPLPALFLQKNLLQPTLIKKKIKMQQRKIHLPPTFQKNPLPALFIQKNILPPRLLQKKMKTQQQKHSGTTKSNGRIKMW